MEAMPTNEATRTYTKMLSERAMGMIMSIPRKLSIFTSRHSSFDAETRYDSGLYHVIPSPLGRRASSLNSVL